MALTTEHDGSFCPALPGAVAHDEARFQLYERPRRRETAFGHYLTAENGRVKQPL